MIGQRLSHINKFDCKWMKIQTSLLRKNVTIIKFDDQNVKWMLTVIHVNIPRNIIIKTFHKLITTSTTIYTNDVQLLFSGTPNNLEQLKIYAEKSPKTMQEWCSKNGSKSIQITLNAVFLQHQISTNELSRFKSEWMVR